MEDEIKKFWQTLTDCGLLIDPQEAEILARTNRGRYGKYDLGAVVAIAATRAAHKRDIRYRLNGLRSA